MLRDRRQMLDTTCVLAELRVGGLSLSLLPERILQDSLWRHCESPRGASRRPEVMKHLLSSRGPKKMIKVLSLQLMDNWHPVYRVN